MEKFLGGETIAPEEIITALRRATIECKVTPLLCGSSFRYKGVQRLMDAILNFLPSPLDIKLMVGINPRNEREETREADPKAAFSAIAFKIVTDPYMGRLTYLRVYSGTISAGETVLNCNNNKKERINRIVRMFANKREELKQARAGDIVAVIGLRNTKTGESISDPKHPVIFERMSFPEPVISVSVEPNAHQEQEKLIEALHKISDEDPTFMVSQDSETGQTLIVGMGELHLEVLVERIRREFGLKVNQGKPRVSYRETIIQNATGEGKFIRQSGGHGQYGHVVIEVEPSKRGSGYQFEDRIVGGAIPKEFIGPVNRGIRGALDSGPLAGFHVIDLKVTLINGSFHEVDSSEVAFKIAGSIALQDAIKKAEPILLEPLMRLEVTLPDVYLGDVVGDLNARRAKILGINVRDDAQLISAEVPLATMFGYATQLRSLSQGRALFTMEFLRYEQIPPKIQVDVLEKIRGY